MPVNNRRSGMAIGGALAVLLLSAAACTSHPGASTDAAAPLSGEPIQISSLIPVSGPIPHVGSLQAAELAVKAINANGGIHGRPLQLTNCDDSTNQNQTAECARRIVASGSVANVGSVTRYGDAYIPTLAAAGMADVGSGAESNSAATSSNEFQVGTGA